MRKPTGSSNQDFQENWYVAQKFGNKTTYGYHDGEDVNLSTGGDTDLGQPLYACLKGKVVFYHNAKHPTTGFGKHMVVEVETRDGKRWLHYAHCQDITGEVKEVSEGEVIGHLGESGTEYAHLHFSVFKVDPSTLPSGIDTVAKTQEQLNAWWEDPAVFYEREIVVDNAAGMAQWLNNSDKWRGLIWWMLPGESPEDTPLDKVQNVINGIRSRVTAVEGERDSARSELKVAQQEVQNRIDQVANVEAKCQRDIQLKEIEISALKESSPSLEKLKGQYEGTITLLEGQLREAQKQGGIKDLAIADLQAKLDAKIEAAKPIQNPESFDIVKLVIDLFNKIVGRK